LYQIAILQTKERYAHYKQRYCNAKFESEFKNLHLRKVIIIIDISEKILFDSNFQYNAALANIALSSANFSRISTCYYM